ncbi:hypothetical protein EYD10_17963 [Varanus komodoensis]|nr:hypothetical protein EYD10_17963 [Varanus komodoensis]
MKETVNCGLEGRHSYKMLVLVVLVFMQQPEMECHVQIANCKLSEPLHINHEYYQAGDISLVGIISQIFIFSNPTSFRSHPSHELHDDLIFVTQLYQHTLAFVFAVQEINEKLLGFLNLTLGFHLYNSHFVPTRIYLASLELLSTWGRFIPNYKCDAQDNVVAVIGGPHSYVCYYMSNILFIYKIPQVGYGSTPMMSDQTQEVFFQGMFPKGDHQYLGILHLLLYFQWTWIGVISVHFSGEEFVENELPKFAQRGICFDFIETLPTVYFKTDIMDMVAVWIKTFEVIINSSANVVIVHGEMHTMIFLTTFPEVSKAFDMPVKMKHKVWIMTAQMEFSSVSFQRFWDIDIIHGALSISIHSKEVKGFQKFLQMRNPLMDRADGFIRDF